MIANGMKSGVKPLVPHTLHMARMRMSNLNNVLPYEMKEE